MLEMKVEKPTAEDARGGEDELAEAIVQPKMDRKPDSGEHRQPHLGLEAGHTDQTNTGENSGKTAEQISASQSLGGAFDSKYRVEKEAKQRRCHESQKVGDSHDQETAPHNRFHYMDSICFGRAGLNGALCYYWQLSRLAPGWVSG
jgi:hypothetical protein